MNLAPQNIEMEQELLGALMSNQDAILHLSADLKSEHFHEPLHQRIFEKILQLRAEGKTHNAVALKSACRADYLASLVALSRTFSPVAQYSQTILDLALQRRMLRATEEMERASQSGSTVGDLVGIMATAINDVNQLASVHTMRPSNLTSIAIAENFSRTIPRTKTGLAKLDRAMGGGLVRGQAYAFGAPPGTGKTMLAGTISHHINYTEQKKHLFICAEMGDEEIHSRSLARSAGTTIEGLEGMPAEAGYHALMDPGNVIYQSDSFLTLDSLKKYVANALSRYKIEGFILDYFQLVRGMQKNGNLVLHLEEVAQWIAAYCKANNLWAIVTSQLNKDGKTRWGDGMEMAFTNVFYLHRVDETGEEDKTGKFAWIETAKTRHTKFMHVGSPKKPSLVIDERGPHFAENHVAEDAPLFSCA